MPTHQQSRAITQIAVQVFALLTTGLLAGAFGFGAVNVVPTFSHVPLDTHLTFHAAMMRINAPVMVPLMVVATLSTLALALSIRGPRRRLSLAAGASTLISFVVTRWGNVPINQHIKAWAAGTQPPPDYLQILHRWEVLNLGRTTAALLGFLFVIAVVSYSPRRYDGATMDMAA